MKTRPTLLLFLEYLLCKPRFGDLQEWAACLSELNATPIN